MTTPALACDRRVVKRGGGRKSGKELHVCVRVPPPSHGGRLHLEPQAHLTPGTALNQKEKALSGLAEVQAVSCRRLVGWAASLGLPGWREEGKGLRVCTATRSLGGEGRGSPHPNSSPRCETSYGGGGGGTRTSGSALQCPDPILGMGKAVPSLQSWVLMWGDTVIPKDLARAAASPQCFTGNLCKLQAL